jgi:hypothetical protein
MSISTARTKALEPGWDIDLRMFDLTPRGPYAALMGQWDILLHGFPPVERAPDYVILDLPYLGVSRGRYSRKAEDMANMGEAQWKEAVHAIAWICAKAGARRCTIIAPAWVDKSKTPWRRVNCPRIINDAWEAAGYHWHCTCYASRHIQQHDGQLMKRLNAKAKECRVPLSDIAEVLTFDLD